MTFSAKAVDAAQDLGQLALDAGDLERRGVGRRKRPAARTHTGGAVLPVDARPWPPRPPGESGRRLPAAQTCDTPTPRPSARTPIRDPRGVADVHGQPSSLTARDNEAVEPPIASRFGRFIRGVRNRPKRRRRRQSGDGGKREARERKHEVEHRVKADAGARAPAPGPSLRYALLPAGNEVLQRRVAQGVLALRQGARLHGAPVHTVGRAVLERHQPVGRVGASRRLAGPENTNRVREGDDARGDPRRRLGPRGGECS